MPCAQRATRSQVGRPDGVQPRPGALPRGRDDGGRRAQFAELTGSEAEVNDAVDCWVWYAGWADKLGQVLGSSNPVAGPYFNFTVPEPTGVVGVVAPEEPPLAGLVARLAPPRRRKRRCRDRVGAPPACGDHMAEVLATSDVPGGVVNLLLTGRKAELCPVLAAHMDVNAVDLAGAGKIGPSWSDWRPTTSNGSSTTATANRPGMPAHSSSSRPSGTRSGSRLEPCMAVRLEELSKTIDQTLPDPDRSRTSLRRSAAAPGATCCVRLRAARVRACSGRRAARERCQGLRSHRLPFGTRAQVKIAEARQAMADGAGELELVLNTAALRAGDASSSTSSSP